MNENYTAQDQAQKGFKTFILTLSVSLIIFSIIYYFISDTQSVSGSDIAEETPTVKAAVTEEIKEEETVFGKIASAPVTSTSRAVLANGVTSPGTTSPTVTETTTAVPSTGVTQLTWGFFISLISFLVGFFVISKNPRGLAIQHFEKKMLNK